MTDRAPLRLFRAAGSASALGRVIRVITVNTAAAVGVALMFALLDGRRSFLSELAVSLVISHTIGSMAFAVLPRVAGRLEWSRPALAWAVLVATLVGLAVVGCLVSAVIVVGLGLVPMARVGILLWMSLRISLLVSLGLGVGCMLYESTRARLDAAEAELRAKEIERERALKLAAEAQLASLESRLHPHFLFNTLNAISALIPTDPEGAERLVEQLAALLRFSLDASGRHTVPLAAEVAVVSAYLGIEQARLGNRLRYSIEMPDELEGSEIPPLALHTLVQNSVKHVAAARSDATEIRVRGERRNGLIRLCVWDTGEEFSVDTVPRGHGLDSLRARLEVLYGEGGRLEVESADGGKVVSISLPLPPPSDT